MMCPKSPRGQITRCCRSDADLERSLLQFPVDLGTKGKLVNLAFEVGLIPIFIACWNPDNTPRSNVPGRSPRPSGCENPCYRPDSGRCPTA